MAGKRHSKPDQDHLDQATAHLAQAEPHLAQVASHLAQAGASISAPDTPKSLALHILAAAKAVPAGFDPGQYALGEAWDAATAAQIIPQLASLLSSEMYQQDADGVSVIQKLIAGLAKFIASETADMTEALIADAAEDDAQPDPTQPQAAMLSQDSALVAYGTEIKALGDGLAGGYLVRYGDDKKTDLTGDFFNAKTDTGPASESDTYYNHGLDNTLGKKAFKNRAEIGRDDIGVWIKHQLDLRNEYEKAVYGLVEQKKLGWSSGTAAHLVERETVGKATWIKRWPLGLDASYTPTPAEPRNSVITLKSLISGQQPGQAAPDGAPAAATSVATIKDCDMTPEELKALQDAQAANTKAIADLTATQTEVLKALRAPALPTVPAQVTPVNDPKNPADRPFKNLGEQMYAIRDRALGRLDTERGNRLDAVKAFNLKATGASELVSSEGGDLVQFDFADAIFQRAYSTGALTSRCAKQAIGAQYNGVKIPAVDEQSRVDGSRFGGIRAYWAAEAQAATKSKPSWRLLTLELKKLLALVYATDELNQDSVAFESFLMRTLPLEIGFKLDDAIINGPGGGLPLGVLNAPATVSVVKEVGQAAATINFQNIVKMWARMWAGGQGAGIINGNGASQGSTAWFVNQDTLPQLFQMTLAVGTGGVPVFMPPGGLSGSPYGTLFNRPVIPVEQCATLGTVGDILLLDLSQYVLADKGGIQAAQSIHVQFTTDEMTYRWTYRADGQPLWNTALTPYKGTATQSPFISLATR